MKENKLTLMSINYGLTGEPDSDCLTYWLIHITCRNGGLMYNVESPIKVYGKQKDHVLLIREVFERADCNYIVTGYQGIELALLDQLMAGCVSVEDGLEYPALTCMNNELLKDRCRSANAKKVIYAVESNKQYNEVYLQQLKQALSDGNMRLHSWERVPYFTSWHATIPPFENARETICLLNDFDGGKGISDEGRYELLVLAQAIAASKHLLA